MKLISVSESFQLKVPTWTSVKHPYCVYVVHPHRLACHQWLLKQVEHEGEYLRVQPQQDNGMR